MNNKTEDKWIDGGDYHLKLRGRDWEINIHMTAEEFQALSNLCHANWETRGSVKAGYSANSPVFWSYHDDEKLVSILVGQDDETWDFAVTISIVEFVNQYSQSIHICNAK
jgi:hypothetical protein